MQKATLKGHLLHASGVEALISAFFVRMNTCGVSKGERRNSTAGSCAKSHRIGRFLYTNGESLLSGSLGGAYSEVQKSMLASASSRCIHADMRKN